jgi:Ni/Co efflux regulator RcnB
MKRLVTAVLLAASLGGPLAAAQAGASGHSTTVVATTSRGWVVSLAVAKTTVRTGAKFSATITIDNRTGHSVTVEGCQPNFDFSVELANAKVPYRGLSGAAACSTKFRAGSTVIHTQVTAVYSSCGGPGQPSCANPDLPVGTYHTVVQWPTGPAHIPEPGRLYIRVVG